MAFWRGNAEKMSFIFDSIDVVTFYFEKLYHYVVSAHGYDERKRRGEMVSRIA